MCLQILKKAFILLKKGILYNGKVQKGSTTQEKKACSLAMPG